MFPVPAGAAACESAAAAVRRRPPPFMEPTSALDKTAAPRCFLLALISSELVERLLAFFLFWTLDSRGRFLDPNTPIADACATAAVVLPRLLTVPCLTLMDCRIVLDGPCR